MPWMACQPAHLPKARPNRRMPARTMDGRLTQCDSLLAQWTVTHTTDSLLTQCLPAHTMSACSHTVCLLTHCDSLLTQCQPAHTMSQLAPCTVAPKMECLQTSRLAHTYAATLVRHSPALPLLHATRLRCHSCTPHACAATLVRHTPALLLLHTTRPHCQSRTPHACAATLVRHTPALPLLCATLLRCHSCTPHACAAALARHTPALPLLRATHLHCHFLHAAVRWLAHPRLVAHPCIGRHALTCTPTRSVWHS